MDYFCRFDSIINQYSYERNIWVTLANNANTPLTHANNDNTPLTLADNANTPLTFISQFAFN